MRQTRRTLLRRVGVLSTAGTAAVAGCQSLTGESGDPTTESTATDADATATEGSAGTAENPGRSYEGRWLVDPDALGLGHYAFTTMRPSTIQEHKSDLSENLRSMLSTELGLDGVGTLGSIDAVHRVANAIQVMEGPFDRETLTAQLTGAGFEQTESNQGHDLYSGGESRGFAVSDERFVQVGVRSTDVEVDARAAITTTLDAHAGALDRYQDVNDDCARLLSALGEGDFIMGRTDEESWQSVEGAAAEGGRWRVASEQTDVATAVVYPSADATDASAVEEWASEGQPFGETAPSVATDEW